MRVLVTGANGMLGQDLCPILEDNGYEVIETNKNILDITDSKATEIFILEKRPDIIIHCAAYTNVDLAESNYSDAYAVNVTGSEIVAKAAKQIEASLVYISTDYVFDGTKNSPYLPSDIPNPINNYGKTKYLGEEVVKKYCKKYYIIRTSWLYGHHGNNFVEKIISLKDKEKILVVNDEIGCPTWTVDLSNAIIDILNEPYGIYHACGNNSTSRYDFAKEIFKQLGIKVNLVPCSSKEFKLPAKRPKFSVLGDNKSCRNWDKALKDYLNLRID